jgi:hypothetical protein
MQRWERFCDELGGRGRCIPSRLGAISLSAEPWLTKGCARARAGGRRADVGGLAGGVEVKKHADWDSDWSTDLAGRARTRRGVLGGGERSADHWWLKIDMVRNIHARPRMPRRREGPTWILERPGCPILR